MLKFSTRCWSVGLLLCVWFMMPHVASSQNSNEPKEVTQTYLLKNAHITTKPGQTMFGHILIRDGLIAQVGPSISAPFDAQVIDMDSMYIYAGFIDALSHTGVKKPEKENNDRVRDPGNPTNKRAGITPEHAVTEDFDPQDGSVKKSREAGFTIAHVVPRGRMLPGMGGVFSMAKGASTDMVIADDASMFSQLRSASRVAPGTLIGVLAKYRDIYRNAEALKTYSSKYATNPSGLNRAKPDDAIAAFVPVVSKQMPVFFAAKSMLDVSRIINLQKELGFKLVLSDVRQGWPMMDKIKRGNYPVVLSLDLPKEIKEEEKKDMTDEEKAKAEKKKKKEEAKLSALEKANKANKAAREERKKKSVAEYESQAAMMEKSGVKFAFSTMSSKPSDARKEIRRMIKAGLSERAALAALTTNAADILGISRVAGTLESGKMAHIVVTDKPLFEEKSAVRYIFVDGQMNEMKKKEEKKGDVNTDALSAVAGVWSYSIEIPGETQTGNIKIEKDGDDAVVSISSSDNLEDYEEVNNVNLEADKLTFDFQVEEGGMQLPLSFDIDIEGNNMTGKVNAGNFGAFPIEATKKDPK